MTARPNDNLRIVRPHEVCGEGKVCPHAVHVALGIERAGHPGAMRMRTVSKSPPDARGWLMGGALGRRQPLHWRETTDTSVRVEMSHHPETP